MTEDGPGYDTCQALRFEEGLKVICLSQPFGNWPSEAVMSIALNCEYQSVQIQNFHVTENPVFAKEKPCSYINFLSQGRCLYSHKVLWGCTNKVLKTTSKATINFAS